MHPFSFYSFLFSHLFLLENTAPVPPLPGNRIAGPAAARDAQPPFSPHSAPSQRPPAGPSKEFHGACELSLFPFFSFFAALKPTQANTPLVRRQLGLASKPSQIDSGGSSHARTLSSENGIFWKRLLSHRALGWFNVAPESLHGALCPQRPAERLLGVTQLSLRCVPAHVPSLETLLHRDSAPWGLCSTGRPPRSMSSSDEWPQTVTGTEQGHGLRTGLWGLFAASSPRSAELLSTGGFGSQLFETRQH